MMFPLTARTIRRLYHEDRITLSEAQRMQAYRKLFWRQLLHATALLGAGYILAVILLEVHA